MSITSHVTTIINTCVLQGFHLFCLLLPNKTIKTRATIQNIYLTETYNQSHSDLPSENSMKLIETLQLYKWWQTLTQKFVIILPFFKCNFLVQASAPLFIDEWAIQ